MKRRMTLNLDEDVAEALGAVGGKRLPAVANDALQEALATQAHRLALLRWLDDLDQEHGAPTADDLTRADQLLDDVEHGRSGGESGA